MFAVKVMPNFEIPSHKIYRNYEPLYNSGSMSTSVNPASENCISVTLQSKGANTPKYPQFLASVED